MVFLTFNYSNTDILLLFGKIWEARLGWLVDIGCIKADFVSEVGRKLR